MPTIQEQLASYSKAVRGGTDSDKTDTKIPINFAGSRARSARAGRNSPTIDLSQVAGLEELAKKQEYKPPTSEKVFSALRKVGGILNFTNSVVAGGVKGAINPDMSVGEGVLYGIKNRETFGYADILRDDLGFKPQSGVEKVGLGVAGFIGDVLFDPLTYLTFGVSSGLKATGKTLTKEGTKLFQKSATELTESMTSRFLKQGFGLEQASKMASKRATPLMNDLVQRSLGKKGLTQEGIDLFLKEGIADGTLNTWKQLGPQLIDKGGIKFFGRTLVASNTLKNTPVAKAARRVFVNKKGEFTTVGAATDFLKQSLGKTFVADFGKNPKLTEIIEGMSRQSARVFETFIEQNSKLFEGLDDIQMTTLFDEVFKKKLEVAEARKAGDEAVAAIKENQKTEKLKFDDPKIQEVADKLFEGGAVKPADMTIAKYHLEQYVFQNNRKGMTDEVVEALRQLNIKPTGKITLYRDGEIIDDAMQSWSKNPNIGKNVVEKEFNPEDIVIDLTDPRAKELFTDIGKESLEKYKALESEVIVAPQKSPSLVSRLAKMAGVSEEEAIKFYVPSIFEDKLKIKNLATGNKVSSSDIGYKKKFLGYEEGLIRDPFKAYTTGQVKAATNRIKDSGFKKIVKELGSSIEKPGLVKVTRKNIMGETVEGWFPKEMAEEINKFLEPKMNVIDELAKATGFDWATGLFKGYVTSLFPGFHMRNLASNQFLNMLKIGMDVANPALQRDAAYMAWGKNLEKTITTKTGKTVKLGEILGQVNKESDILDASGPFGRMEQFLKGAREEIVRGQKPGKYNPLSRNNLALEAGRKVGQATEAQSKLVSVLSAVMEGKTVKEGIKQAEEALFNYNKLTDFERTIMRRMIPFYSFARKNFELQVRALATKPGAVASQLKFFRGASNAIGEPITEEDLNGLPDWVLEGVGIKSGVDEYGRSVFFSGFGLPIEEFLGRFSGDKGIVWNFVDNVITQTNPVFKVGAERATGQDFFRGRPITEVYNAQDLAGLIKMMPGPVGKQFKELIEFKEIPDQAIIVNGKTVGTKTKYTANPFALHFLHNIPSSRILSTYGFLTSEEETNMNKLLRFFSGVKGWTIDLERQQFFKDLNRKRELTDWLIRMGVVKEFSTPYLLDKPSSRKGR